MAKMFETAHVVIYVGEPDRLNEGVVVGKDSFRDAVKWLLVGPHQQPVLGTFSAAMKRPGSEVTEEIGWMKFAQDERYRGQWDAYQGECEIFVTRHAPELDDDARRVRKMRIRWDGIEFFDGTGKNVIWSTATLGDGAGAPVSTAQFLHELKHPNGIIWYAFQGDGNLVGYKNRIPFRYDTGVPFWSNGMVVNP